MIRQVFPCFNELGHFKQFFQVDKYQTLDSTMWAFMDQWTILVELIYSYVQTTTSSQWEKSWKKQIATSLPCGIERGLKRALI